MKKGITAAVGISAAVSVSAAVRGYMYVMAREGSVRFPAARIAEKRMGNEDDGFSDFTKSKHAWIEQQDTQRVSISSKRGELLRGWLTLSKSGGNAFVLFAHGYHSDHMGDPANFMRYYVEKGYNFLAVDHVSHGESSGRMIGFDYFESDDCLEWLSYLTSRFGNDIKIILHGVSMGAATVCRMMDKIPTQVCVAVADCPYTSALDEFSSVVKSAGIKHPKPILTLFNTMNKGIAGYDLRDTDVRAAVKNARAPMLFVHGGDDTFVPTSMGRELYELCGSEKQLLIVSGAKHAESIYVSEEEYQNTLTSFLDKYINA